MTTSTDTTDNVLNIADAPQPLRLILRRKEQIKQRLPQIKREQNALTGEHNELVSELHSLDDAERTVRCLLARERGA